MFFLIVKWIYFAFNDYNFILLYVIIKTFYAITVIYQSMIFSYCMWTSIVTQITNRLLFLKSAATEIWFKMAETENIYQVW